MTRVKLSAWSQRMVVAECLAVATLATGTTELDISAEDFERAFTAGWSRWAPARQFPAVRPEEIVTLLGGPRTVPDAIAEWRTQRPFRPSLRADYRQPADTADLIASYTGIPLPVWEELARGMGHAASAAEPAEPSGQSGAA
jgi:hypothetical protein